MLSRRTVVLTLLALAVLMGACSSESSVGPSTQRTTTLSQVLSEMTLPWMAATSSVGDKSRALSFGAPVASNCAYSATLQSFACPTATANGLTITQSFTLLDASGKPQSQFDANATAAVRLKSTIAGTPPPTGTSTLSIDQQLDMTVSGLLTSTHVLNGTMTTHMTVNTTSVSPAPPTSFDMNMSMSNLVLPPSTSGGSVWPLSGTITEDLTSSDGASGPAFTIHATLTFNGTSKVAAIVTIGGMAQQCTIDLSIGSSTCG